LSNRIHRSWLTQRIANRIPDWADGRQYKHSFFQQMLNPSASMLEELFKYAADGVRNSYLATANLDILDILYTVQLPSNFEFVRDPNSFESETYVAPVVLAKENGTDIVVEMTESNTIEDFYYNSVPTRVLDDNNTIAFASVMAETSIENIDNDSYTLEDMPIDINGNTFCNRLVVVISGCEDFVNINRRTRSSFLVLTGITSTGREDTERIYINYNGTFITKKIWKQITDVSQFGLTPSTGTIYIGAFPYFEDRDVDKYMLDVDIFTEKLLYHSIDDKSYGTVHQYKTVVANKIDNLYAGQDTLYAIKEIELGYETSDGVFTNVSLWGYAIQPFTGRLFGVDDTHLYIWDQFDSYPDYTGMSEKSDGPDMIIASNYVDYVRNDVITFEPFWRRQVKRIYRNRWHVTKPDGTTTYLDIDGNEISSGDAAWIGNRTYTELVFGPFPSSSGLDTDYVDKQRFDYTLSQRGTYKFKLEVDYVDGTTEVDILPVQVHYKVALARLELPTSLQNYPDTLFFDSEQKLWLVDYFTYAHKLRLATDNMLIDFDNKIVYLHENYDEVTVYPSDDWVD